jgi:hypothetical protein
MKNRKNAAPTQVEMFSEPRLTAESTLLGLPGTRQADLERLIGELLINLACAEAAKPSGGDHDA